MRQAIRSHWQEYLMESLGLGLFLASACFFATLLEHPDSPLRQALAAPLVRRGLMGLAMGLSAVALIRSPWGQRSGAHLNPAVTLAYLRLGRIAPWDAVFYALAQVAGAIAGVGLMVLVLGPRLASPSVRFAVTEPGPWGPLAALAAEAAISFLLFTVVLGLSNHRRLVAWTPWAAAALIALYISFEAPLSGMSMNPARSLGSALWSGRLGWLWLYFLAPPVAMLAAAEVFVRRHGLAAVLCAKLDHINSRRCIFRCRFDAAAGTRH